MANEKLTIALTKSTDRNGSTYYLGRIQFPGTLDLSKGAVFWVFTSEDGNEEIQIGNMDHSREQQQHSRDPEVRGPRPPGNETPAGRRWP